MRECGMLLPVASLPSKYGIGAFSREAYEFIDTLKAAGQQWWQILPLGPTGFGDSPYQSFTAFGGNPYFIDLETLTEEGLLSQKECQAADFGVDERSVDYEKIYKSRFPLLRKAYERWKQRLGFSETGTKRVHELAEKKLDSETREYCFYMALKNHFGSCTWNLWERDIRRREPEATASYRELLSDDIGFYEFQQIKFEEQWRALKSYANRRGIKIIGDIPIYVALDSADSWAHPELFQFDEENTPLAVAGCPPDAFSATGQLWGNPLYNWKLHETTGYAWWMKRMAYSFHMYDLVRVDHFRGFDEYYSIPYGDPTAEFGHWEKGPGIKIFKRMQDYFGREELPVIAEDLGFLTPSVLKLVKDTGFPGMKVLEFAFDRGESSSYLPHNYSANSVVYTGTHDNDTAVGWFSSLEEEDRAFVREYTGRSRKEDTQIYWEMARLALSSVAKLAVIPVQDYLGLDGGARINEPSTLGKNWKWRMDRNAFDRETVKKCRRMARLYGRNKKRAYKIPSWRRASGRRIEGYCFKRTPAPVIPEGKADR